MKSFIKISLSRTSGTAEAVPTFSGKPLSWNCFPKRSEFKSFLFGAYNLNPCVRVQSHKIKIFKLVHESDSKNCCYPRIFTKKWVSFPFTDPVPYATGDRSSLLQRFSMHTEGMCLYLLLKTQMVAYDMCSFAPCFFGLIYLVYNLQYKKVYKILNYLIRKFCICP